jgi:glycosyltransferase involved in cell wall biosynthesis
MPRLLQIVHGYPPRELAGTEIYAERITRALAKGDWEVHILAATRAPGKPHGQWLAQENSGAGGQIHRIVNNLPWRPLKAQERDPLLAKRCNARIAEIDPDLVHVQHLLFLDIGLVYGAPALFTMHDAWAWCARAGSLLEMGETPCPGPSDSRCGPCYADFSKGQAVEHQLGRIAGKLDAIVPLEWMHKAWRSLPAGVRSLSKRGNPAIATPTDVQGRQTALRKALNSFDLRISPSAFLAQKGREQGLHQIEILRHGAQKHRLPRKPEFFLFLGSLAFHKGPQIVAKAWQKAITVDPSLPPLRIVGPPVEANCVLSLPEEQVYPAVPPDDVPTLLSKAHALVLGSIWPENAPLVILEALAAGCPVIAPAIGGIPEMIQPDQDGWLFPPGDVSALGDLLLRWQELKNLSVRAPNTFDEHLNQLLEHYTRLMGGRG